MFCIAICIMHWSQIFDVGNISHSAFQENELQIIDGFFNGRQRSSSYNLYCFSYSCLCSWNNRTCICHSWEHRCLDERKTTSFYWPDYHLSRDIKSHLPVDLHVWWCFQAFIGKGSSYYHSFSFCPDHFQLLLCVVFGSPLCSLLLKDLQLSQCFLSMSEDHHIYKSHPSDRCFGVDICQSSLIECLDHSSWIFKQLYLWFYSWFHPSTSSNVLSVEYHAIPNLPFGGCSSHCLSQFPCQKNETWSKNDSPGFLLQGHMVYNHLFLHLCNPYFYQC